jgi:hypothetical protein
VCLDTAPSQGLEAAEAGLTALIATRATKAAADNLDFIDIRTLHPLVRRNRNGSHRSSTMPDGNRFEAPMKMVSDPLSTRQREPALAGQSPPYPRVRGLSVIMR